MIWVVIFIAVTSRLISLNQSLWLDEADNVVAAKMFDFASFITKYPIGDFHPPGYFALLWLWTHIFGFSEIAARLPSVFLGVGTVIFAYLLGRELFDKKVALLGALLLAISPLHVYYSQEARMYSLAAFSVVVSYYYLWQLTHGKRWSLLGYVFSTGLVLYSDYVAYLIIPAQLFYLFLVKQKILKKWFFSLFLMVLLLLPWLVTFPQQFSEGREAAVNLPNWKKVAGGADIKNIALVFVKTIFGRISLENKFIYGILSSLVGIFYGLLFFLGLRKMDQPTKLLFTWLMVPLLLAIAVSGFIPLLSYFRMLFILPAFYLLIAKGVFLIPRMLKKTALVILVTISLLSLSAYYFNPRFQREDWRGASQFLDTIPVDQAIILFEDNHVKFPIVYYKKNLSNTFAGLKRVQARSLEDVNNIETFLNGKKNIYLFEYLVEITDPDRFLEKKIISLGFIKSQVYNFQGVGLLTLYEIK